MPRCEAKTIEGRRCLNMARGGCLYCTKHSDQLDIGKVTGTVVGMAIGNAILPGIGGLLMGGASGNWLIGQLREGNVAKKKVFVSFDFDNDKALKDFIIGQSRHDDAPFEIVDHSLKEAAPERNWETKAKTAIKRSDLVIVMVGPATHRANGVLKEVDIARTAGIPIVQIIGYRDGNYTPVPNAGRLYSWSWENLKKLLS